MFMEFPRWFLDGSLQNVQLLIEYSECVALWTFPTVPSQHNRYNFNVRRTLCGGYAKKIPQNIHILFRILFEIFFFNYMFPYTTMCFPYTTIWYMFENPYTTICFPYTTICFGAQLSVFRTQLYGFRTQLYGFRTQHIPTLFSVHNYMFETMFVI